jgi:hypothetical protein
VLHASCIVHVPGHYVRLDPGHVDLAHMLAVRGSGAEVAVAPLVIVLRLA